MTKPRYTNEQLLQIEDEARARKDGLPHVKLKPMGKAREFTLRWSPDANRWYVVSEAAYPCLEIKTQEILPNTITIPSELWEEVQQVVEFYGNKKNWVPYLVGYNASTFIPNDLSFADDEDQLKRCGATARAVQDKIRKWKEGQG